MLLFLVIVLQKTLACQVYYNKDFKFDFTDLSITNLKFGDDNEQLFINLCGLLDYQCVIQSSRILEDDTTLTIADNDDEQQDTNTNETDTEQSDIDNNNTATTTSETSTTTTTSNYILKQDSTNKIQSLIISENQTCNPYSEQNGVDQNQVSLIVDKKPFEGIIVERRGIIEKDIIKLKLQCSTDLQIIDSDEDGYLLIINTSTACPILLQNPLFDFFDTFKIMFSILLWLIGLFLLIFGYQLAQLSSMILAAAMGFAFTTVIVGEATLDYDSSNTALIVVIVTGVVVAFIYFQASVHRFFFLLFNFGFSVGLVISLMIQSMIYYAIVTDLMYFPLTTSIFVLGIIFGILGLRFNLMMGIISTSLTGAYCLIRPIGFIFGGYPNELLLTKKKEYGFPTDINYTIYLYNASVLLIAACSIFYQRTQHQKRVKLDETIQSDIKYYEMGNVEEEEKQKQNNQFRNSDQRNSDQHVTIQFAKHLQNEDTKEKKRLSHLTGSDINE